MVTKQKREEIAKQFGGDVKNTGDTAVQIALLTEEINELSVHFATNKKDLHSQRGFIAKIEKRKKLITYLKSQDFARYQETIKALGLRK